MRTFYTFFYKFLTILSLLIATFSISYAEEQKQTHPIKMGLLPYLSPAALLKLYTPLVRYLSVNMHRSIQPVTAPNFKLYLDRASTAQYDLCLTAPHFARLAEEEYGYQRVARVARELDGDIVVRSDSGIKNFTDMKGKIIAAPDPLAIITMLAEVTLMRKGLHPNIDFKMKHTLSHNAALLDVAENRADVAVVSAAVFENLDPNIKQKLKHLTHTELVPHMMIMASPNMSKDMIAQLQTLFLSFDASPFGKDFFKRSGYKNFTMISDPDMAKLDDMVNLLHQALKD